MWGCVVCVCACVCACALTVMSMMSCYGDEHACVSSVLSLFRGRSGKSRESFRGGNIIIILNELCVCIVCVCIVCVCVCVCACAQMRKDNVYNYSSCGHGNAAVLQKKMRKMTTACTTCYHIVFSLQNEDLCTSGCCSLQANTNLIFNDQTQV